MFSYLDITKSVIISSPAGSGKTEKLARRYIALLKSRISVERILAITFTDKAAAEMKQRILRILREEDEELFRQLIDKMSLMRVSTIHSFCGTLLRRFSFEAGIPYNYRIEDAIDSRIARELTLHEILMDIAEGGDGYELLLQSISERGFKGFDHLNSTINNLFEKMPFSLELEISKPSLLRGINDLAEELKNWRGGKDAINNYETLFTQDAFQRIASVEDYFLTDSKTPRKKIPSHLKHLQSITNYKEWAEKISLYWQDKKREEFIERAERIKAIFKRSVVKYHNKKISKEVLDFSDLEYMVYKLLLNDPEWSNILYAFDERTDHILVDEFQDTNNFQWAIIDKLTEEWRSGMGAKKCSGITPTIFLVGDEKQSIYLFRGANVEIFHKAKEKLKEWLKDEFVYEEVKENFRSKPAIVDFTNCLFARIMIPHEEAKDSKRDWQSNPKSELWITRYSPFVACRDSAHSIGKVEVILLDEEIKPTAEVKKREADIIAKRIQSLVGNLLITDKRQKTEHSTQTTDNGHGQRYCNYMDIAILLRKRTHIKRYEDAFRQYGIPFAVVKGIGFYQEPEVAMLRSFVYFLSNPKDDYNLYILLKSPFFMVDEDVIISASAYKGEDLLSRLKKSGYAEKVIAYLEEWLFLIHSMPIAELLEKALVQTHAWEYFYESQKRANIKKFIRIVEGLEAEGKPLLKIRDFLEKIEDKAEEPKANVNTEGMNAVRIMTIHAAKGLEFPIVFVPGIEEPFTSNKEDSLIYESQERFYLKYLPDPQIRKFDEDFITHLRKEEEEQKRLLYVAATRTEEALFLIGQWNERDKNFLNFLKQGLGLQKAESKPQITDHRQRWEIKEKLKGFSILSEEDVDEFYEIAPKPKTLKAPLHPLEFIPIRLKPSTTWNAVTELVDIKRQHGKEWVTIGDVMHRLFENVSKVIILENDIRQNIKSLLTSKGVTGEYRERLLSIIENDISLLKEKGIWQDIIMPREDAFSELPIIYETDKVVYTGRIDRLIKEKETYKIYDYKTFPANEKEIGYLLNAYAFQLDIYKTAIKQLFKTRNVLSFIVFTHLGKIEEI